MKPTSFRAYASQEVVSRRNTPEGRMNVAHDVHDVVADGALKDGVASFTAKQEVSYVTFYGGKGDDEVCLGRLDGPFPAGKISADFADIPEEPPLDPAAAEVALDGVNYRKVD